MKEHFMAHILELPQLSLEIRRLVPQRQPLSQTAPKWRKMRDAGFEPSVPALNVNQLHQLTHK